MKIAFIGKGGSGKTSISSAFATHLAKKQKVLFIDADVNAHAHECFGLEPSQPLSERKPEVAKHLIGNRDDITYEEMIGSTPPAEKSTLIKQIHNDEFVSSLSNTKDNLSLITVGTYTKEDSGINCYHSKLGPVAMILHHTIDSPSDTIVMDATAGVDILGTSLYAAFDVFFFIIEPTKKSISVLKTFISQTKANVIPILNKVKSEKDIAFVKSQGINVKIVLKDSDHLRLFEQGATDAFSRFAEENETIFLDIYKMTQNIKKDLPSYYQNLAEIYKKGCEVWYNDYYKKDLFGKTEINFEFLKNLDLEQHVISNTA